MLRETLDMTASCSNGNSVACDQAIECAISAWMEGGQYE
jgi:hypothetical protein